MLQKKNITSFSKTLITVNTFPSMKTRRNKVSSKAKMVEFLKREILSVKWRTKLRMVKWSPRMRLDFRSVLLVRELPTEQTHYLQEASRPIMISLKPVRKSYLGAIVQSLARWQYHSNYQIHMTREWETICQRWFKNEEVVITLWKAKKWHCKMMLKLQSSKAKLHHHLDYHRKIKISWTWRTQQQATMKIRIR